MTAWHEVAGAADPGAAIPVYPSAVARSLPASVRVQPTLARGGFRVPRRALVVTARRSTTWLCRVEHMLTRTARNTARVSTTHSHSEGRVKALVLTRSHQIGRDLACWPVEGGRRTTLMVMYSPADAI